MEGGTSQDMVKNNTTEPMVRKLFSLPKTFICNKNLKYPVLMNLEGLTQVHPAVKGMFRTEIPRVPLAGRLKHFLAAWKKLTGDKEISNMVEGLEIPFVSKPFQTKIPHQIKFSPQQEGLVLQEMLQKGAVIPVKHQEGEFLSNIFLVPKKEGLKVVGQRPVINLKELNKFLVCDHFKIESLNLSLIHI